MIYLRALPTNGDFRHALPMDRPIQEIVDELIAVVAENLAMLMKAAKARGERALASALSLAASCKLGRPTIEGMRKGTRAIKIDTLATVADAFGYPAWVMLIEGWSASNPPVLREVNEAEKEFWRSVEEIQKQRFARGDAVAETARPRTVSANRDKPRTKSRKKVAHNLKN